MPHKNTIEKNAKTKSMLQEKYYLGVRSQKMPLKKIKWDRSKIQILIIKIQSKPLNTKIKKLSPMYQLKFILGLFKKIQIYYSYFIT